MRGPLPGLGCTRVEGSAAAFGPAARERQDTRGGAAHSGPDLAGRHPGGSRGAPPKGASIAKSHRGPGWPKALVTIARMPISEILLLGGAAFIAGALNSVAGGGSFLTLPALALVGVPLVSANATGTTALLPGYLAGAWAFRRELAQPMSPSLLRLTLLAVVGGAAGALLLLSTPNKTFGQIVPWLLLAATLLFALGPLLLRRRSAQAAMAATAAAPAAAPAQAGWGASLAVLAVAVYGGYFNGGLGILLLAVLGAIGMTQLHVMNGIKNFVSAILTAIAVLFYAADGAIVWSHALGMMLASTAGGYLGGALARKLPPVAIRTVVVLTGAAMTVAFFLAER